MHTYANSKKIADISASDFFRDPDAIRTRDRLLRRQMLYPAELPDHRFSVLRRLGDAKLRIFWKIARRVGIVFALY